MPFLEIENLRVVVDDFTLREVSFCLNEGEVLALLGPSGAGKTTLIEALSGLTPLTSGRILIKGRDITHLPVHKRRIGIVFQDLALFPHLNVYENISFGLKNRKLSRTVISEKVNTLLALLGLSGFEKRDVSSLSGGEKQRVALARTLAPEPDIILFDEPLSAVDEELRSRLREQLSAIQQRLGFTALYVTHDRDEAFYFADMIGVIFDGRIWQIDKPQNVYEQPVTPKVAEFLGIENRLRAEVIVDQAEGYMVRFADEKLYLTLQEKLQPGDLLDILIKPEKALLTEEALSANTFPVTIKNSKNYGSKTEYIVELAGQKLKVLLRDTRILFQPDDHLHLTLNPKDLLVYKNNVLIN
jgi:ABC-type Fe3+/spermidine/putrescine transport system ATPase subunit